MSGWVRAGSWIDILMFEGKDTHFAAAGLNGNVMLADAMVAPLRQTTEATWRERIAQLDLVPDLGEDIGSIRWFRGLGTLTLLSVSALALLPDFGPITAHNRPLRLKRSSKMRARK